MEEKKLRNEDAARQTGRTQEKNRAEQQNNGSGEERRVLPKDPETLNPSQKGPAQPSDGKTNPT